MQLRFLTTVGLLTPRIQAGAVLRFGCSTVVVERLDP